MLRGGCAVVLLRLAAFTASAISAVAPGITETLRGARGRLSILSKRIGRCRPRLAKAVPTALLPGSTRKALPVGIAGSAETLPPAGGRRWCMKGLGGRKSALPRSLAAEALPVCHKLSIRCYGQPWIRDRRPM